MAGNRTERVPPAPVVNPESKPFWEAAAAGRFLYGHCLECGEPHFYPRSICPFCFGDRTEMREARGEAEIYAHSTMRRADPPYTLAYVTLAEGPRVLTNIVTCDPDRLRIGQKVWLAFVAAEDGQAVPVFSPQRSQPS